LGELAILGEYLPLHWNLKAKEEELDLFLAQNEGDGKIPKYFFMENLPQSQSI